MLLPQQFIGRHDSATKTGDGQEKKLNMWFDSGFYIFGKFDDSIATELLPQLVGEINRQKTLNEGKVNKTGKITFYINSYGGCADYAWNLLSLIERAKREGLIVETHVFGYAYSCGSLIACAGSKGHRFVGEYAEHCCHLGSAGTWSRNDTEHERESARVKAHFNAIRAIYRKYATIKNLEKAIHDDSLFIRGKDIIRNGLADHIV